MEGLSGKGSPSVRRFKEPVAFFKDPVTGEEYAKDKKGKKLELKDTRYNLRTDPFGWKATGKKVREEVK